MNSSNVGKMNIEARKLQLIERFMKFEKEADIAKLDKALSDIEMEMRVKASEADIAAGRVRTYESFGNDVKAWMEARRSSIQPVA